MYLWLFRILMAIALAFNLYGTYTSNEKLISFGDWLFLLFTLFTLGCTALICVCFVGLFLLGFRGTDTAKKILERTEKVANKQGYTFRKIIGRIWLFGFIAFMAYTGSPWLATLSVIGVLTIYGMSLLITSKAKEIVAKGN